MKKALVKTDFHFPGQKSVYHGKVRDVYNINDDVLVMVATDRISAFDVILPEGIPYKGQILNQIASKFLDLTTDICPNWKLASPDPMVTVGICCKGFPVEMIVRGYLCGSACSDPTSASSSFVIKWLRTFRIRSERYSISIPVASSDKITATYPFVCEILICKGSVGKNGAPLS